MSALTSSTFTVIDSHTGGEPTRLIVEGGPDLGKGPLMERRERMRAEFDHYRTAIMNEPRGSDVMVGALLCEPCDPWCAAGVIFFNNVGYLNMCGHGTIGLVATLAWMGRLQPGEHRIETPVGIVTTILHEDGRVTVRNVPSWRSRADVAVDVPGYGTVKGDIAWGGNWFYLVSDHQETLSARNTPRLTDVAQRIRDALTANGITGDDGGEIDHVELFGPPESADNHSRNFVLCPGGAWDRSPCGTGTSAKLACLAASGKLAAGQTWRQESIIGSLFEGIWEEGEQPGTILPYVTGRAWVNGECRIVVDAEDPFGWGL